MKFSSDTVIGEILRSNPNAEEILTSFGMHCLYCPCSQAETLGEACQVHGIDVEKVVEELNKPVDTRKRK